MAPPSPALPEELVEEILLRLPPDDPASLVRASLVCKPWRRLLSERGFLRRYRALHRKAPMLGFIGNVREVYGKWAYIARFVPTSSFRPPRADRRGWHVLDARHGRVLLYNVPGWLISRDNVLAVWDPITDQQLELPKLPVYPNLYTRGWNAAVLCAAGAGCDHLDCHRGPFLVVFVATLLGRTFAHVYSSEDGTWSETTHAPPRQPINDFLRMEPGALVGNTLYFLFYGSATILEFDLTTREMFSVSLPPKIHPGQIVFTAMEGGGLGITRVEGSILYQWSREESHDEDDRWTQSKVIELKTLLPVDALESSIGVRGVPDGTNTILVCTWHRLFSVDLKSNQVTEIGVGNGFYHIVSYMSFYTPALGEGQGVEPKAPSLVSTPEDRGVGRVANGAAAATNEQMAGRVMAAAAVPEAMVSPARSSPRLARAGDDHAMDRAVRRAAARNLEYTEGSNEGARIGQDGGRCYLKRKREKR
ncbi:hypothetical protein ACP70R_014618 [Stipagrostis hirtigluma subsp. patula]